MPRVTQVLRRASKTFQDLDLLKILKSELNDELSSMRFQNDKIGSLGDFVLDWDSPKSQDVVLRKKCSSGEEVAVSALLSRDNYRDGGFPWDALMKICVKKPGFSSILQFESALDVQSVNYIPLSSCVASSNYRSPIFRYAMFLGILLTIMFEVECVYYYYLVWSHRDINNFRDHRIHKLIM